MSSNIIVMRICEFCHKEFIAKTTVTRFCSHECNSKNYKAQVKALKIQQSNIDTVSAKTDMKKQLLDKELLTVRDVCELTGFSKKAVYIEINKGLIKVCRPTTRRTRIMNSDFQNYLNRKTAEPFRIDKELTLDVDKPLKRVNCYGMKELVIMFNSNAANLYTLFSRHQIAKVKFGKEIYFSKLDIDKLFRKFKNPLNVGQERERQRNFRLQQKGFQVSDCYSMQQCIELFNEPRAKLVVRFRTRCVPKVNEGRYSYYLKKSVDRIYKLMKEGKDRE